MWHMKRARKWSADNKVERHAGEPGGPLRRRKALRHLDSLALDPERELSPAAAHVRVIGGPGSVQDGSDGREEPEASVGPRVVAAPASTGRVPEAADAAGAGTPDAEERPQAQRVHAVPIDQPFSDPSRSVAPDN
jgi:hypothetical protein